MSSNLKSFAIILTAIVMASCAKDPNLSLPAIISDNMVLQQNQEVAIWGKAAPGTEVKVVAGWGSEASAVADADGKWLTRISTIEAGGPYDLTISARKTQITVSNVMLGEVWLASGQSNMEMTLAGMPPFSFIEGSEEAIANSNIPEIRFFTVAKSFTAAPADSVSGSWEVSSPETAPRFSAAAYFFALNLNTELSVPVGIIHSSWGGTPAESWISQDMLAIDADYKGIVEKLKEYGPEEKLYDEWLVKHETKQLQWAPGKDPFVGLDMFDEYCSNPATDTEDWPVATLPAYLEQTAGEVDGIIWYRKKIEVPAAWEGKNLTINLGPIDDRDVTYFNGTRVGAHEESGFYQTIRTYTIPAELVKAGEAVIAVKITDNQGGGGMCGTPDQLSIHPEGDATAAISLAGEWQYALVGELKKGKLYVFDPQNKEWKDRPFLSLQLSQNTASSLYNGMINALVPYTLRGAIWYQGEANVGNANKYMQLMSMLVTDWRNKFENEDLSFYYVQIAPYHYGDANAVSSANLREAQRRSMDIPNTGMISTLDIGNVMDIHPANKKAVGERLALWALAKNYGKDVVYSGPIPASVEVQGSSLHISFDYANEGLIIDDSKPNQFEIAGEDGVYYEAKATVNGSVIVLTSPKVSKPVSARYAYRNGSVGTLFNGAGLPAPTFNTQNEIDN